MPWRWRCDENGETAATLPTERSAIDLSEAEYRQLLARGLPYQRAIALPPGRYQVRLAVREDAMGLLGSAWQRVEIPDLAPGRLTLSSLFLLEENKSNQAAPDPAGPPDLRSAQALRHFHRGDSLYAQVYAYNPKRDASGVANLVSQAEILRGGVTLGTAAPEPFDEGPPQGPPAAPHHADQAPALRARRLRAASDGHRQERERDDVAPGRLQHRLGAELRAQCSAAARSTRSPP